MKKPIIKHNILPEHLNVAKIYEAKKGHVYLLDELGGTELQAISFINGGRNTPDCVPGITHEQLMEVVIDRITFFSATCNTNENDEVLLLLKQALDLMNQRTIERDKKNVLGNDGSDYEKKEA